MMQKIANLTLLLGLSCWASVLMAQNFPPQWDKLENGYEIAVGKEPSDGLYDESVVKELHIDFSQANYWTLLTNNYQSGTDILATITYEGEVYDSVGVRFRGNTSYQMVGNSQKKSFNITLNAVHGGQDIDGYNSLNLNNGAFDHTFCREVLYYNLARRHSVVMKANFIHLFINGESWGLYPNVQQLDGDYIKDWFESNNGTRWRGLKTTSGGGGGGGGFGAGTSSLNYLGTDTTLYKNAYTLKSTEKTNPWEDLIDVCDKLNNTSAAEREAALMPIMDVDRVLWHIAHEIAYSDDDSYVFKGGMDYYIYWEPETDRITTLEYDGNTCMEASNQSWSPFYKETDVKFALQNKLFAVPELRQRYLAHLRTILETEMDTTISYPVLDGYYNMIKPLVYADTKKIYTNAQFESGITALKNYLKNRKTFLLSNAEVNVSGLTISNVVFKANGVDYQAPNADQNAQVTATIAGAAGVNAAELFYGTGMTGMFTKVIMYDDGTHNDGASGDGVFGATIPAFAANTIVRFYVRAVANNTAKTQTYMPKGAEHDVYFYRVDPVFSSDTEIVINEFMASNTVSVADETGAFGDWIELYNKTTNTVDISGWQLSDNLNSLSKFTFPEGTSMPGNSYLIVWADDDDGDTGFHADFKLSTAGEEVILARPNGVVVQQIAYGLQESDRGYARVPNGTGDFVIQNHTFNDTNTPLGTDEEDLAAFDVSISPNPIQNYMRLTGSGNLSATMPVEIFNITGQLMHQTELSTGTVVIPTDRWQSGVYILRCGQEVKKIIKQ